MQNLYFKVILAQLLIIKEIAAADMRLAMTGRGFFKVLPGDCRDNYAIYMPYFIMLINVGIFRMLGRECFAGLPANRGASGEITIACWLFHHLLFVGSPSVIRVVSDDQSVFFCNIIILCMII
jgi:hypothetical protein